MCGGSTARKEFTVTLSSADRTSGSADDYTVAFPELLPQGLYTCHVRATLTATDPVCVMDIRGSGLGGKNMLGRTRNGYVPALTYSHLQPAQGVFILDAQNSTPAQLEVLHTDMATGQTRVDTEEHVICIHMVSTA